MANRHLSRSVVLQTLFEWDFRELDLNGATAVLERNSEEFAPGIGDFAFMKSLLHMIVSKQKEIDQIIEKAAPDWPLAKIANVDRNVLRLGLGELLFADRTEVPAKVAINEAIELAKSFGGETSGKFVNGVLGAVYKGLGEPGKDDVAQKKKKEILYEDMVVEHKAGAVVYARHGGEIYFALVHDIFGHWTLSKGGAKNDETIEIAGVRSLKEEMGVDAKLEEILGENEYVANHPEKGKHRKHVVYYLASAPYEPLTLGESGGLDEAKWFQISEIGDLNFYDDILPLVTKAIRILMNNDKDAEHDSEKGGSADKATSSKADKK